MDAQTATTAEHSLVDLLYSSDEDAEEEYVVVINALIASSSSSISQTQNGAVRETASNLPSTEVQLDNISARMPASNSPRLEVELEVRGVEPVLLENESVSNPRSRGSANGQATSTPVPATSLPPSSSHAEGSTTDPTRDATTTLTDTQPITHAPNPPAEIPEPATPRTLPMTEPEPGQAHRPSFSLHSLSPPLKAKPDPTCLNCPICLDTVAQPPDALLARYVALSRLLASPEVDGGPPRVEFRAILGHAQRPPSASSNSDAGEQGIPTPCGHVFHAACLSLALAHATASRTAQRCPMCRTSLDVVVPADPADPAALPRLHGAATPPNSERDLRDHPPARGVAPVPAESRYFYVRGRFVSLVDLRMRPGRRAWRRRAFMAASALICAGVALLVLRFAFPSHAGRL